MKLHCLTIWLNYEHIILAFQDSGKFLPHTKTQCPLHNKFKKKVNHEYVFIHSTLTHAGVLIILFMGLYGFWLKYILMIFMRVVEFAGW